MTVTRPLSRSSMKAARTGALLIPRALAICVSESGSPNSSPPDTMASRMRSNASVVIDMRSIPPPNVQSHSNQLPA